MGGGVSASLLSIALLSKFEGARIAIIERNSEFEQKVGESTIDLAALCLRSFGIDHILDKQVEKGGLRFFFGGNHDNEYTSEFSSPSLKSKSNGFHLNRKTFDEDLLQEAKSKGVDVYRPATVLDSEFKTHSFRLKIEIDGDEHAIHASRFVDCTGRAQFLKTKLGWKNKEIDLNTSAIMSHASGIDFNELSIADSNEYWNSKAINKNTFSTLHFMHKNAWWWLIRIDENTTSIGVVYDKNKVEFEDASNYFTSELKSDQDLSKITEKATFGVIRHIKSVAYSTEKLYDDGATLIGDSGTFIDPMISPGLELICQQVIWLSDIYANELRTKTIDIKTWNRYQKTFLKAYEDRIEIYKQGYHFMEHNDLMTTWLRAGNFLYFAFYVNPAVLFKSRLKKPLRIKGLHKLGFNFLKWRLNRIVKLRAKRPTLGKKSSRSISYSGIWVAPGIRFYLIPMILFWKFSLNYFLLECKNASQFLFGWMKTAK